MDWDSFYNSRINSSYQDHFERKYAVFLAMLLNAHDNYNPDEYILEAGCGIGSVSKFLAKYTIKSSGFDLCSNMVQYSRKNNQITHKAFAFWEADLFNYNDVSRLTVTHGVLEHFSDDKILEIIKIYPNSVHYVPLDKYIIPSFGDERLLPVEHWLDLVKPVEYKVFNNGLDLAFKINNK